MARKILMTFAVMVGLVFFALSAFLEYDVSRRPPPMGTPGEIGLRMASLEQTVSAGSSRIFAGLCFVTAAILYAVGDRRPAGNSPAG